MSSHALAALLLVAAGAELGCTSTEMLAPGARMALAQTTTGDAIRLPVASGGTVDIGPSATLHISAGGETSIAAGELYTNEWGLFKKNGDPIGSWDDVRGVKIEQLDGLATVAVSATVVIAFVALAAVLKSAPSGASKGPSSSGSSGKSVPVRSAPNPPSVPVDPQPALTEVLFRTAEGVANVALSPTTSTTTTTAPSDDIETTTATPLFSRGSRRRARVRVLARLEGGACWPGGGAAGDCLVSGARAGLRLIDVFELSAGVRVESNSLATHPLAVVSAMLHGESPAAHWFALALGASVAFDGFRTHVVPQITARFSPARGLWLGVVPVEPVYASETGTWNMASGVEVTGEL